MTYIRTLGRGFTFDDPDTAGYLTTTSAAIIYIIYNIQINVYPETYGYNSIFKYADSIFLISACIYIVAALRDDHWFWFLPFSGQYGVATGKVETHSTKKILPQFRLSPVLIYDLCRKRQSRSVTESSENVRLKTFETSPTKYSNSVE